MSSQTPAASAPVPDVEVPDVEVRCGNPRCACADYTPEQERAIKIMSDPAAPIPTDDEG